MAHVDQFLRAHTQPGLLPGETILGMGLLRRPLRINAFGVPQAYQDFLGVATDRRLIVFETETGGILTPTAKPVARNPIVWRYDELATVRVDGVAGLVVHSGGAGKAMGLIPHPGFGPLAVADPEETNNARRYDVYAHIDELDGQRQFYNDFPDWLKARVAAGAFPMDPAYRAEVTARREAAHAARIERNRRQAEASRAFWAKALPILIRVTAAAALLGITVAAVVVAGFGYETHEIYSRESDGEARIALMQKDLVWTRAGGKPPSDCPEKTRKLTSEDLCHGCKKLGYGDTAPLGWKKVDRSDGPRYCPPAATIEQDIKGTRRAMENRADTARGGLVRLVLGSLLALGTMAGGVVLFRWDSRKRRAQASAPA